MAAFAFRWGDVVALLLIVGANASAQSSAAQRYVDDTVAAHKVAIFSKSYCGFSMRAKALINSLVEAKDVHVVELDQRPDGPELQDYLLQLTGGRTVPRVFVGGAFVGGASETAALHAAGGLEPALREAGVALKVPPARAEL